MLLPFGALAIAGALLSPIVSSAGAQTPDTTVRLSGNAVVDITLRTGRLVVRGVEGVTGAVRGGGRDYQLRPSGVGIVVNGRDRDTDRGGPLELDVPRGVRLVVNTVSADVELYDVRGDVDVRTMTGDVRGDGLSGRVIVEMLSGDVGLSGTITQLRATTVSGDLRLRGLGGTADIKTTSGEVDIVGDRIGRLGFESISGDLRLDGALADDAQVRISTHAGDVTWRMPAEAKGRLELSTVSGELSAGGPLTLMPGDVADSRRGRAARRYEFNGGGAMQLDISTFSGDVRILRGIRS
jgi:hypothetical protein